MKAEMFEELLRSVREGGSILRGQKRAARRFFVEARANRAGSRLA